MNVAAVRGVATRAFARSTPGERWTAALVMLLALALLRFGMPSAGETLAAPVAAAQPVSRSTAPAASTPSTAAPSGVQAGAVPTRSTSPTTSPSPVAPAPATVAPGAQPPVVLLLRKDSGAPDRDDAAIAAAFAAHAAFPTRAVTDSGTVDQCPSLLTLAHVFIASDGVEPALRDCLLAGGAVVVAFDPNVPPPSGSGLVSTRLPLRQSIEDVARVDRGRLAGRVGIVTTTDARPEVDAAVESLRRLGVNVQQVAALSTGPDAAAALPPAVLAFQGAQIDTVLFAAPVDLQGRWAALTSVVRPGTRFVVADGYDAVIDESYPTGFDGATAVTAIRTPWADRQQPTALQQKCSQAWETAATPPVSLGPDEQLRVFEWCQHLDLVARAGTTDPSKVKAEIQRLRYESPLTSDLAPLADGSWGPSRIAELQWHANCECWQPLQPFMERTE